MGAPGQQADSARPVAARWPDVQRKWAALDVPDEITEAETVRLPWHIFSHDPPDIDKLKVTYAEGTVHLIHTDGGGGSTEFTCTRL
ncbi:hypothetical protein HMPREF1486_00134 [Streptomyces sp. HPH0547]|nr:hypothetical protein HMPREF1486_00134 [Streptomyces sp. HPH0547]